MKKILLFAAAFGLLTACDPIKDDGTLSVDQITADELLANATFVQYAQNVAADGTVSYVEASDGNYIKYNIPNASAVTIFYIKDDGTEGVLSSGKSGGMFTFVPKRGSDPLQTLHFRYINQNGEEVEAEKQFTVAVAADLSAEMKLLVSDDGVKTWKWNPNAPDGRLWGNMGSNGSMNGVDFATQGGSWWGVTNEEEFLGQLNHTNDGSYHDDGSLDATMVIDEEGIITCYDASGKKIRSGSFSISDYDPTYTASPQYCGILNTDAGSILWPYEINSGGNMPTWFEITYLTPSRLVLCYPDKGAWDTGGWSEGTFWQFYSETDVLGCLTDNSSATWGWDDDNAPVWGNCGYGSFAYSGAAALTGGSWWGVSSAELDGQITDYKYGLADGAGATMTLTSDGLINKSSGGSGSFTYDVTNTEDLGGFAEGKTWGRFTTTGDGILFPVRINAGVTPNEFDIVYMDDDHFVLAYPNNWKVQPDGSEGASWMEGTFWRFKKVR